MTTPPRIAKYRRRPGAPLFPGIDPGAVRERALEDLEAENAASARTVRARADAEAKAVSPRVSAIGGDKIARAVGETLRAAGSELQGPQVAHGEISSAAEVDSETQIAAIRREGLTGRQLRMARRVAQKHGLAPTSDFDAVRLLRAKGVDPFDRGTVLQLVAPTAQEETNRPAQTLPSARSSAPEDAPVNLPSTVTRHSPPARIDDAPPGLKIPEDRAGEIWKIQRDIARRRRRKMVFLLARLSFFVFLPTLIAGWYFAFVATPMYATKSEFVIQQADGASGAGAASSFLAGTGLASQQDSTSVQSYLLSMDAMLRLDRDQGFTTHFMQDGIDPLQQLEAEASNVDAFGIYERNVKVGYDPSEGILKMEVIAASPEASQRFSEALIGYAEQRVNDQSQRLREDQMSGAMQAFEDAEGRVLEAQQRVLELQERLGVLDPISETGSLMQQITQFEVQLREKQLERDQLLSNARPNQARVSGVEGEIGRLQALVDELRASMTVDEAGDASLASVSGQLRIAEAELQTRQLLLQNAAQQLETARIEANRQVRYMAVNVNPIAPDEPTYPRVFENTALAFAIFAGIYLMLSLTASVLREQVSA
ncbi:MAG: capsule biosynthesis protein [Pseudomonadota bacterium]